MTDPGRWETITGSAHTVTRLDVLDRTYPFAEAGDVVLELEAATQGDRRVGHRIHITRQMLEGHPHAYGHALDRMTHDLDKHSPIL